MRKDFIHTEEEKQKRKQRLEENRQLLHGCQTSTELVVSPNIDPSPAQSNDQVNLPRHLWEVASTGEPFHVDIDGHG